VDRTLQFLGTAYLAGGSGNNFLDLGNRFFPYFTKPTVTLGFSF
jgi:hypothetical protein